MADTPKTDVDFDNLSDEDFLKLDPSDYSGNLAEGETDFSEAAPKEEDNFNAEHSEEPDNTVDDNNSINGVEPDGSHSHTDPESGSEKEETLNTPQKGEGTPDPHAGQGEPKTGEENSSVQQQSETDPKEKGKAAEQATNGSRSDDVKDSGEVNTNQKQTKKPVSDESKSFDLPEGVTAETVTSALAFYDQISKPFKADGKDFTVRSPEDAIRLMQKGLNYSRRMGEIKPMRQIHRMLQDHGLTDQTKLNHLIDLSKGDKDAITALLKSHKIDPMDLDVEKDSGYQANNYAGNTEDNTFRDALDDTITTPEGQALVTHINQDWDRQSKAKLRENPAILGNLTQMKQSGVYDKVVEELTYQRSIGYLTGIPFLQAFDQVGEAMKNAGVFDSPNPANGNPNMGDLKSTPQGQPVASGVRKPQGQKKPEANPHLSSTPPSRQTNQQPAAEPDYDTMSDEDFLKMPPPS